VIIYQTIFAAGVLVIKYSFVEKKVLVEVTFNIDVLPEGR